MQIIFKIIAEILLFILCVFPGSTVTDIRNNLDIDIKPYQIEFHKDTHGGFHGDGEEIIIFRPTAEQIEKIKSEWQKTPVDIGIASLIFPKSEYNGLELRSYIPNTKGYWFYKNRNEYATYSHNFSFALFDGEKVYYYELDT